MEFFLVTYGISSTRKFSMATISARNLGHDPLVISSALTPRNVIKTLSICSGEEATVGVIKIREIGVIILTTHLRISWRREASRRARVC